MKLFHVLLLSLIPAYVNAEVFKSAVSTNLVVDSNSAVLIFASSSTADCTLVAQGNTNTVSLWTDDILGKGVYLNGPFVLNVPSGALLIKRYSSQPYRSLIIPAGSQTNINVLAGKTLIPIGGTPRMQELITIDGQFSFFPFHAGLGGLSPQEYEGPVTLTISNGSSKARVFSYYFSDEFTSLSQNGYLQNPSGSFELLIEKSTNLVDWSPMVVKAVGSTPDKEFYRLKILNQ